MLMSVDLFSPLQNRCWGKNIVLIIMYNKFRKLLMKVRSSNATFEIFFLQIVSKLYPNIMILKFEAEGKIFEITRTIYSNSERS